MVPRELPQGILVPVAPLSPVPGHGGSLVATEKLWLLQLPAQINLGQPACKHPA